METPRTRYAQTVDGVHIAYQVRGVGHVDLVYVTGYTSNFEVVLEEPHNAAFLAGTDRRRTHRTGPRHPPG